MSVTEEREGAEDFVLTKLDPAQLQLYLRMPAASPALKQALQESIDRKTAVADAKVARASAESLIARLAEDQERVRRNLQSLAIKADDALAEDIRKISRDLVQRYLTKLGDLETELERQRIRLEGLKLEESRKEAELDAFLEKLLVE